MEAVRARPGTVMVVAATDSGVAVEARELPRVGAGDAVVRPVWVGVARADLSAAAAGFRGVLGHEFAGVVESVGSPEHGAWFGRRVVGSINLVCGRCRLCRAGLANHCASRRMLGLHEKDGCFTEAFTLPVANLVELPRGVDDEQGVFAGTIASVLHACQRVRFEGKPYVTVLGDGPAGLLTAQVLSRRNASVRLVGKHPGKYTLCERWGIRHRHVSEIGRRMDQDVVVDCTGRPEGFALASGLVRPRGTIIVRSSPLASETETAGVDVSFIARNEIEVIGACCGRLIDGVEALARGDVDVRAMVSAVLPLASAGEAFAVARQSGTVKVLMRVDVRPGRRSRGTSW